MNFLDGRLKLDLVLVFTFVLLALGPIGTDLARADITATTESESEIPEPLFFDLVRRLDSQRGEYEFNTLFSFEGVREASGLTYAPEVEYSVGDGFALELELPIADGKLHSIKGAVQKTIGTIVPGRLETGVQAIVEQQLDAPNKELSLLSINGLRFKRGFSVITLIGPINRVEGRHHHWGVLANGTLFYNNSREVDVALEVNYRRASAEPSELKVIPQLHLLFRHDVKIQFGIGAAYTEHEWLALSAMRAVLEFN